MRLAAMFAGFENNAPTELEIAVLAPAIAAARPVSILPESQPMAGSSGLFAEAPNVDNTTLVKSAEDKNVEVGRRFDLPMTMGEGRSYAATLNPSTAPSPFHTLSPTIPLDCHRAPVPHVANSRSRRRRSLSVKLANIRDSAYAASPRSTCIALDMHRARHASRSTCIALDMHRARRASRSTCIALDVHRARRASRLCSWDVAVRWDCMAAIQHARLQGRAVVPTTSNRNPVLRS
jgi:hypothetical protein